MVGMGFIHVLLFVYVQDLTKYRSLMVHYKGFSGNFLGLWTRCSKWANENKVASFILVFGIVSCILPYNLSTHDITTGEQRAKMRKSK